MPAKPWQIHAGGHELAAGDPAGEPPGWKHRSPGVPIDAGPPGGAQGGHCPHDRGAAQRGVERDGFALCPSAAGVSTCTAIRGWIRPRPSIAVNSVRQLVSHYWFCWYRPGALEPPLSIWKNRSVSRTLHLPYIVEQDEDGVWCASAQLRPGVGAVGDGETQEAAIADLREALAVLIAETGAPPELTLTLDVA
jgi:predicted RNase H-like HicB family nuclease